MEQRDGLHHECPNCAPSRESPPAGWSRRSLLGLGLAAGVGAATARISPSFAGTVGPADREVDAPGAALVHSALARQPNWPVPKIVTRAQWGCNEALRKPGHQYNSVVEKIVVHHTVTPNNPADPAAVVRSVYLYNVSGEYIDIAYHFLIDQYGRIYEGRWARDYPAGVPHTGENSLHANVQGAATLGHNPRTIAVAMLGTFTDILPTPAALSSLVTVLTWKCARWGIDPRGSTPYTNSDGGVEVFPNILGHRAVYATICPGDPITARLALIRDQVAARLRDGTFGYWIAAANGRTLAFGDVPDVLDPRRLGLSSVIRAIVAHPSRRGYWALGTDGGVFTFGTAPFFGSMGGRRLNQPVVGMASTRTGNGYWLVARDGGIFCFGDARFFGSTGAIRLNQPIVAMEPTPSGNGYWLVARDGGVFCFGDARFFGSTGAIRLNQPIVAMSVTPKGSGYWLVARDGGIFCFGDARFFGSGPGRGLRVPAVAVSATTSGLGYALLAADGTVLAFGDARSYGNATGVGPVVGFAGRLLPKG
jgi:hypothetical protein